MHMSNNKQIEKLLKQAMTSKQGGLIPWYEQVPSEVQPFVEGLKAIMRQGKRPNATAVSRILTEELNFPVSRTRVAHWIREFTSDLKQKG
jgi:hypothetical protein